MTISLAAVFIPVLFMGGIVGRLLHEFAVTIGVAILVSGFVVDQPDADAVQPLPEAAAHAEARLASTTRSSGCSTPGCRLYDWTLRLSLRFGIVTMAVSIALIVGTGYLFTIVPKGFLPSEDQGRFNISIEGDPGHRLRRDGQAPDAGRRHRRQGSRHHRLQQQRRTPVPAAADEERPRQRRPEAAVAGADRSVEQIIAELRPKLAQVPGVRVYMVIQPPINIGGQQGARSLYQFTLQDTDIAELYQYAPILEGEDARDARPRGRQQRPADQEPAGHGADGSRQDLGARPDASTRSRRRSTTPTARARCRRSTRRTISIR